MATNVVDEEALNPKETLELATSLNLGSKPNTNTETLPNTVDSDLGVDSEANDAQKKIRRAERFGFVPVQFSEEEKRSSRAERFGTSSTVNKSETTNSSEEEEIKRKARAERFGLPVPPVASEEEAKKNARLARFAPYTKPDPQEDDKRKARAIRFSTATEGKAV